MSSSVFLIFEGESTLSKILRLLYAIVTYDIMFIFVRVWGEAMPTHSFFYSFTWAIGFIPGFILLFLFARKVLGHKEAILDANWPMIKQSIFIGLTFAINYLGVSAASPHVQGPAQVVLSVGPIGLSGIFTALLFKRHYNLQAWFGIILIITGSVLQVTLPGLSGSTTIGWALLFALGNLPSILWSGFFEGFHKYTHQLDNKTNTMELRMMWTNVFLVLWLLLFIPIFGALNQPPMATFWDDYAKATVCTLTGSGGYEADKCDTAHWILFVTIPIATLQAHSQIVISRHDTGLWATLLLAVSPFLCDVVFNSQTVMGRYYEPVSKWDGIAAAVSLVGLLLFSATEFFRQSTHEDVQNSKVIQWFMSNEPPVWLRSWIGWESDEQIYQRLRDDESTPLIRA